MVKDSIYKKSVINFIYSYIIVGISLLGMFGYMGMANYLLFFIFLSVVVNITIVLSICYLSYNIIRLFVTPYLILSSIIIYFLLILFWNHSPLSLIWYTIFPVAVYHFFNMRTTLYWSIYIVFLIIITFFANYWFEIPRISLTKTNLFIINIFTLFAVIYFISFFLYYKYKITLIEFENKSLDDSSTDKNVVSTAGVEDELYINENLIPSNTLKKIYADILDLFENDDIYLDCSFNISKLAEILNTNVSYVSRALNSIAGSNFNAFLNKYRIEYVKRLIKNDDYDRYKLTYLYTQAGFKNQSTFNKVFKDLEGITPTEYIQKLKESL
ncbi:helix-turn-helix domain-containing protein [Chryseobacterium sp. RP-3-3]|uniref:Helix-turn-helix domain-containing protein n=1 Tax=Chryseobacterium antibioticum TaxID=2728847 RepID=A0A7Y0ARI1_9FLAO|nr:AraC family transcriptional regulator [Chryseobacterium antibioticum]NML72175.1 helix-turn-helix domain-containing protein [Chryseobacterium antibioticum]